MQEEDESTHRKAVRTIVCRVAVDDEADALLNRTVTAFHSAVRFCVDRGYNQRVGSSKELHQITYHLARKRYGLGAQLACSARDVAWWAIQSQRAMVRKRQVQAESRPVFGDKRTINYDQRSYSLRANGQVTLSTLEGRITAGLVLSAYHRQRLDDPAWKAGAAVLVWRKGSWWLHITQSREVPEPRKGRGDVRVILSPSELVGFQNASDPLEMRFARVRERRHAHRKSLLAKNTRRARWRLRKLREREQRFQRDANHQVAKGLVRRASEERKALVVYRINPGPAGTVQVSQRQLLDHWPLYQLEQFILYKAALAGVRVDLLRDPG